MAAYLRRRLLQAALTIWAVSILSFVLIELPPGDFVTAYVDRRASQGIPLPPEEIQVLRVRYGLDQPAAQRYLIWMGRLLRGDLGVSWIRGQPVSEIISDRLWLTMTVSLAAILFTWAVALPLGVYSAIRQYSAGDYLFTLLCFAGVGVPNFLLGLLVMYLGFVWFDADVGGLLSTQYADAPWNLAKLWDLVKHLPLPALVLGVGGTAHMIRILRANLLDELSKPYVLTARAKGLSEVRLLLKYPLRVALNPFVSTAGYLLPYLVSGSVIVSMVMSLPTVAPVLLSALMDQDLYLAGTLVLLLGVLTVAGTLISDLLLLWIDPRNPVPGEVMNPEPEELGVQLESASSWQLTWRRFRRHKLAVVSLILLGFLYLVVLLADFVATADPNRIDASRAYLPPPTHPPEGRQRIQPPCAPGVRGVGPQHFPKVHRTDPDRRLPVRLLARGYEYDFLGLVPTDLHLVGVAGGTQALALLGTDGLGRDLFSRLVHGTRTSLTIGLVGVALSLVLGVVLGGISGFYGGAVDTVIQRIIEILLSIPTIPLWLGLAAAMPRDWGVLRVYFILTVILSLIGWTRLGREVRGLFLVLRQEDYVLAAELMGASRASIIRRHLVPAISSHVIATATLALPAMIIAETSLSFLGLGLRPPAISWGILLQGAQQVQVLALRPWLLAPAAPVIVAILAFNFVGDGLRDAADPYARRT